MNTEEFLKIMDSGEVVVAGSKVHQHMTKLSFEAMKITSIMNQGYHEQEGLRQLFSELIGQEIDEGFKLFPPILYRLWQKYSYWQKCLYQFVLSISRSRWNHHRRWNFNWSFCCVGNIESRSEP